MCFLIFDKRENLQMASPSTASSRRNSTATTGSSRRGSLESEGGGFPFRLKKSKPTSQVKIVFMGKPLVTAVISTARFVINQWDWDQQLGYIYSFRGENIISG